MGFFNIEKMIRIKLTYQGKRLSSKGRILYSYLNPNGNDDERYPKKLKNVSIGGIIEVTKTENGVKPPYEYKGRHSNENDFPNRVEADWAAQKKHELLREMKKVPKTEYHKIVQRLNSIISNLPRNQRKLFKPKLIMDLSD